jgi:hypothetical protein
LIKGQKIFLREKKLEDAPLDYSWRIDEELSGLDATTPMRMSYKQYLRIYQDELSYPVSWSKRFAIETYANETIGNCMYYDIDLVKLKAELGIMIGNKEYWNQGCSKYPHKPHIYRHKPNLHIPTHPKFEYTSTKIFLKMWIFINKRKREKKRIRIHADGTHKGNMEEVG